MTRDQKPMFESDFPEWAGWLVVAIFLATVIFALGAWYGCMLEIRT